MPRKSKVILDTNWYISATINRQSRRRLFTIFSNKSIIIFYSKELMLEYEQVITREKFRKFVRTEHIKRFLSLIIGRLKEVKIHSTTSVSKDEKDNYLVSMSIDSNADYLITGDDHLLVLKQINKTRVVTLTEFENLIANQ